jgi:hypothetical protein
MFSCGWIWVYNYFTQSRRVLGGVWKQWIAYSLGLMKFLSIQKRIQNLKSVKRSVKEHSPSANEILSSIQKGFGGLEVACWPLVPKFAGSNPAEAVGFFGRKNPQHASLWRGSKAVCPTSCFTAYKRTQKWRSRHFRQNFSAISRP